MTQIYTKFPYTVRVPKTCNRKVDRPNWCVKHIGTPGIKWDNDLIVEGDALLIEYYFVDEGDAVLFKLKWG